MSEQVSVPLETLLNEVEVAGRKIRPWSIVDLSKLSPVFERIFISLKLRGVTLETSMESIDKIIFSVLPEAPAILSATLKVSVDEIEKIPNDEAMEIIIVIIRINTAYLKNWFAPIADIAGAIVR